MASSIPSDLWPLKTTATTSRRMTPYPSSVNPLSRGFPSFVPPSPILPVSLPPPTSAASTTPWTPSNRTSPPLSVASVLPAASRGPDLAILKILYRPKPNWLHQNGTPYPEDPPILRRLSEIHWFENCSRF